MKRKERYKTALTTDIVVFAKGEAAWEVLLIERSKPPFQQHWALPGGFLESGETTETCAKRELQEETGLFCGNIKLVGVQSALNRDPRGHVISISYCAILPRKAQPVAASDAKSSDWFQLDDLPPLAFDHADIINQASNLLKTFE